MMPRHNSMPKGFYKIQLASYIRDTRLTSAPEN